MSSMSTGDAANAFVLGQQDARQRALRDRQSCWEELLGIFRTDRPDNDALGKVSTIAEVAIDQVFSAHKLEGDAAQREHGKVKDYAECASLYGYLLGLADAKRAMLRALGQPGD